jgi:hypothetical protein
MPLCNHCNIDKPDDNFYIYRPKKCKDCIITHVSQNPLSVEKQKEIKKRYYQNYKKKRLATLNKLVDDTPSIITDIKE